MNMVTELLGEVDGLEARSMGRYLQCNKHNSITYGKSEGSTMRFKGLSFLG
jgi:hypothetical protein